MTYNLYQDRDYILIQNHKGEVVFTLQPDDRTHAELILKALNTPAEDIASSMIKLKPMNVALGELSNA